MNELAIDIKKKYPSFDITPQHLGQVIRDNNKTRKRTRHEHFPKERYKKPIEKVKKENYKNYFEYAYNLKEGYELKRKPSTRRRKSKIYK